jgi:hypothetical protein
VRSGCHRFGLGVSVYRLPCGCLTWSRPSRPVFWRSDREGLEIDNRKADDCASIGSLAAIDARKAWRPAPTRTTARPSIGKVRFSLDPAPRGKFAPNRLAPRYVPGNGAHSRYVAGFSMSASSPTHSLALDSTLTVSRRLGAKLFFRAFRKLIGHLRLTSAQKPRASLFFGNLAAYPLRLTSSYVEGRCTYQMTSFPFALRSRCGTCSLHAPSMLDACWKCCCLQR